MIVSDAERIQELGLEVDPIRGHPFVQQAGVHRFLIEPGKRGQNALLNLSTEDAGTNV
jgi:hypothetical protein